MYDSTQRSLWLEDQLWPKLRDAFPSLATLPPHEVFITVGYTSSGARGRKPKRWAEMNELWQGNSNEKAIIVVPPIAWTSPAEVAASIVVGAYKAIGGARWGAYHAGFTIEENGTLTPGAKAKAKLDAILAEIGPPPAGYGVPFPVRTVQRTRMRKYVCKVSHCSDSSKHPVIRAASDTLDVECRICKGQYDLS